MKCCFFVRVPIFYVDPFHPCNKVNWCSSGFMCHIIKPSTAVQLYHVLNIPTKAEGSSVHVNTTELTNLFDSLNLQKPLESVVPLRFMYSQAAIVRAAIVETSSSDMKSNQIKSNFIYIAQNKNYNLGFSFSNMQQFY